jgi:hypothetical protein
MYCVVLYIQYILKLMHTALTLNGNIGETIMPSSKKVVPLIHGPHVTTEDMRMLEGALTVGDNLTLKGRLYLQPIKDAAFAAFAYKSADNGATADLGTSLADLEATCSPYKEGDDSTFADAPIINDMAGKKPRADYLYDLLIQPDMTEDQVTNLDKLVAGLKQRAVHDQIMYITKRNMGSGTGGSTGVGKRVAGGFRHLDAMDESWDEAFYTKGAQFLINDKTFAFTEADKANLNFMKGVLAGDPNAAAESESALNFAI